ncbi:MAG: lysoplasmalogenase [Acidimicrobiales bacterium]
MTTAAIVLLIASLMVAAVDWMAVSKDADRVEELAKPGVMLLLIGAGLTLDPAAESMRWFFIAALALSLIGDLALLPRFDAFLVGLGAFLLAHIAYLLGMIPQGESWLLAAIALSIAGVVLGVVGRRIHAGADEADRIPVVVYNLVIAAMFISAVATGELLLILGAGLFAVSDSLLGWGRFVGPAPGGRSAVHVTYHLAQGLLVAGLI